MFPRLKNLGFKEDVKIIKFVNPIEKHSIFKDFMREKNILLGRVCTKSVQNSSM